MTPAFVQQVAEGHNTLSSSPHVLAVVANSTAGNTLILVARGSSNRFVTGVTDTQGNTWTVDAHTTTGVTISMASCHLTNALTLTGNAGGPDQITVTFSGAAIQNDIVSEYSGIIDAGRADVSTTAAAGATVATQVVGPTAAVTNNNSIAISGIATNVQTTDSPSAGWTDRSAGSVTTSGNADIADKLVNAGDTPTITWSFTPNAGPAGAIVVYVGTSGATPQPPTTHSPTTATLTPKSSVATLANRTSSGAVPGYVSAAAARAYASGAAVTAKTSGGGIAPYSSGAAISPKTTTVTITP